MCDMFELSISVLNYTYTYICCLHMHGLMRIFFFLGSTCFCLQAGLFNRVQYIHTRSCTYSFIAIYLVALVWALLEY